MPVTTWRCSEVDGDAHAILNDLTQRGFRLRVDGDRLLIAPASRLTDEDRLRVRRYRDAILATLRGEKPPPSWQGIEVRQPAWGWIALRDPCSGKWYEIRWRDAPRWIKDRAVGHREGRHKEAM